jgi:ferritin-like metal-binding protein YciE
MDKLNQLKDLLKHEINDLYSAEEQIIDALPAMIDKARDRKLKKALQDHLKVTETQKQRLDKIQKVLELEPARKGFLSALFAKKCKGMQGLIEEGEKVMGEEMDPDVMDAAIVGCAQKIEHYEICGYGTARAYAEELGLSEIEKALKTSLDEEYQSDDLLTALAVRRLNKEATSRGSGVVNQRSIQGNKSRKGSRIKSTSTTPKKNSSGMTTRKKSVAR